MYYYKLIFNSNEFSENRTFLNFILLIKIKTNDYKRINQGIITEMTVMTTFLHIIMIYVTDGNKIIYCRKCIKRVILIIRYDE